jgi:hypothetical protein
MKRCLISVTDLAKNLRLLAHDAVGAAKKRRQISSCLKKYGLISLGKGAWLAFRNKDIVSGFIIEGSPLDTYISTFILPAFDRHKFVSWSLGSRVVHCSLDTNTQAECGQAVDSYMTNLFDIRSATDLVNYLDEHQVTGHYPIWVRYICYLEQLDFGLAISYLDDGKLAQLHPVQIEKFHEIREYVSSHDSDRVLSVIDSWRMHSEQIFGPTDQTFSAF